MLARLTYLFYLVTMGLLPQAEYEQETYLWPHLAVYDTYDSYDPTYEPTDYTPELGKAYVYYNEEKEMDELASELVDEPEPELAPRPWVEPNTAHLSEHLQQFGNSISVYFHNIESGFTFAHNANRRYPSASITKAFYALYVYQNADAGLFDSHSEMMYLPQDHRMGSGIIRQRYRFGAQFSQRRLLQLMLEPSDNVATKMLVRYHGLDGFRAFAYQTAGLAGHHVGSRIMNSHVTARESGAFMRAIYDFVAIDSYYARLLRRHMSNSLFPFIVSDYPLISKSGDFPPYAWHDVAVVYAPSPYVLVILSAREGWGAQDFYEFREISLMFQAFNTHYFY